MAGEFFSANNIKEYWQILKAFHLSQSPNFREISKGEYDSINRSEREDSDNHINQEAIGDNDTKATDVTFYKYLPNQEIAYRSHIVDQEGNQEDYYYIRGSI